MRLVRRNIIHIIAVTGAALVLSVAFGYTVANAKTVISSNITTEGTLTVSGTATSTFAGGFAIETSGFVYDFSTNRVGIGTAASTAQLHLNTVTGQNAFLVGSTTTQFIVDAVGNVGVGTSSPSSIFSINGVANFRTATTTFAGTGGVDLATGCFSIRGTCSGSGTVGSGTTGQFPYYAADSTVLTATSTLFLDTTSRIGIGSTTPWALLSITNTGTVPGFIVEDSTSPDSTPFIIDATGNVGIGTSSPAWKLAVAGVGSFDDYVRASYFIATSTTATSTFAGGLAVETSGLVYDFSTDRVGIGLANPTAQLQLNTAAGATAFLVGSTTTQFIVDAVGNVGVGTSSPSSIFSINGVANFRTATTTFAGTGGVDLATGCFSIRGTCVGGGGAGSGTVENGTTGQFPYYAAEGTTVTATSSLFLDVNERVGISTTTPWGKFSVEMDTANPSFVIANQGSTTPAFYIGGINQNGHIGIGTTSPAKALSVVGEVLITATTTIGNNYALAPRGGTTDQVGLYDSSGAAIIIFDEEQ